MPLQQEKCARSRLIAQTVEQGNYHYSDIFGPFVLYANKEYLMIPKFFCKGKAIPLQPWTGPKGSRRLRLPDLMTFGTRRW